MKVVEKDNLVHGMLNEEFERCRDMIASIKQSLSKVPKGSLHIREKNYKDKVYAYHYLKYREGDKSISKHVPEKKLEEVNKKLEVRKKYEKELKLYEARSRYLEKMLKVGSR